jgi:hypothetical protein
VFSVFLHELLFLFLFLEFLFLSQIMLCVRELLPVDKELIRLYSLPIPVPQLSKEVDALRPRNHLIIRAWFLKDLVKRLLKGLLTAHCWECNVLVHDLRLVVRTNTNSACVLFWHS